MTFVRPAPATGARRVAPLGSLPQGELPARELQELERLVAADPLTNAVVAARLETFRTVVPSRLGGVVLGVRGGTGTLAAAGFHGGNLLPVGGGPGDWDALAAHLAERPRLCTSIVGRADAVAAMWPVLAPSWGEARAVREDQPLLMIHRADLMSVAPDPRVRAMSPADLARYLPAAVAMFTEELGISPFAGRTGSSYRRRVEMLLATGRAFGIVDPDGRVAFKADVGALTRDTCQLQGVWVRPDLRGQGLGTAAVAATIRYALHLAPTVSLYVNDFNTAARRLYARVGMRQVGSLATVLFPPG